MSAKTATVRQLVLFAVPGLSFLELSGEVASTWPQLSEWIQRSHIGAMNIRTPERNLRSSYLTLGSGGMAMTGKMIPPLQHSDVWLGSSAQDLYQRYGGLMAELKHNKIIVPTMPKIIEHNEGSLYRAPVGKLGQRLSDAGIERAVYGNSHLGKESFYRADHQNGNAPLLLIDKAGTLPNGIIDESILIVDETRPFGVKTDYEQLASILQEWNGVPTSAVIVVELGDLERLYAEREFYERAQFESMKQQVLREIDEFVGKWIGQMEQSDEAWLFSPKVNADAQRARLLLAPWIKYSPRQTSSGMMHSISTKQAGIVSNLDFSSSLLASFGLEAPQDFGGFAVTATERAHALQELQYDLAWRGQVYQVRPYILYTFVSYEIAVLLLALFAVLLRWHHAYRYFKWPILSLLIAPAIMVLLGYVNPVSVGSLGGTISIFVVSLLLLTWFIQRMSLLRALMASSLLNVLVILWDGILLNGMAIKRSIIGYDAMYGARYYGIGNELMGILLGAIVLALSIGLQLQKQKRKPLHPSVRYVVAFIFGGVTFYIGAPSLGTNAGGAIAAVVTFGIAWLRWFTSKWTHTIRWRKLILVTTGLGIGSLLILWLIHMALPGQAEQESHIGRAMRLLFAGDLQAIGNIIMRKLSMNWHLIGVSSWSKVLFTSLIVMAVLVFRPHGVFQHWQEHHPLIMYGYSANAIGAIAALAVNDSGIVAAATMIIFVVAPMLLFKLQDIQASMAADHSS